MSVLLVGPVLPEASLHFLGTQAGLAEVIRTKKKKKNLLIANRKMNARCNEGGILKQNTKAEGKKENQQGRTELTNPIQDCKERITRCSGLAGRPQSH